MRRTITLVLGLMVACTMFMTSCGGNGASSNAEDNSPKAIREKYVGNIIDGNYDKAVDMLADADKASAEEKEQTAKILKSLIEETIGGIREYEAIEETYSKDSTKCTVIGRYTYADGTVKEEKDVLIKTENGWACSL